MITHLTVPMPCLQFGIADEVYGETVAAWLLPKSTSTLSEEELCTAVKEACRKELAYFKVPQVVMVREAFPMTVSGKVQKFKMRQETEEILRKRT